MTSFQETSKQLSLGKCCLVCGDAGFEELLSACSICGITMHHYCMPLVNGEVPKQVPETWLCEDCFCLEHKENEGENFPSDSSNVVPGNLLKEGCSNKVSKYTGPYIHSVRTGKVKYLHPEEVIGLPSRYASTNHRSPVKGYLGSRLLYSSVAPKDSPLNMKSRPTYLSFSPPKRPGLHRTPIKPPRKEQKTPIKPSKEHCLNSGSLANEGTLEVSPRKENCSKEQKLAFVVHAKNNFHGLAKAKKCDSNAEEAVNKPSMSAHNQLAIIRTESWRVANSEKPEVEGPSTGSLSSCLYYPNFPALHVIWRGGFKFIETDTPGNIFDGLQAQLPNIVNFRVYEVAQKMPSILQTELLPRDHVLKDLFKNYSPDFCDIALYFLPSENTVRSKENLRSLFELMEIQNSMLRSYIEDSELLMFTSKQLHENTLDIIERPGAEQFIWGIFRRTKRDRFPSRYHLGMQ